MVCILAMDNVKLKQCPVDKWTTREKLCLTSAVSQTGDQNWGAVSRAIRQLTTEAGRPPDWYSTKNCALQYAKLLEQVEVPKRKREKGEGPLNETPGEIVTKMLSEKRVEELKGILEEEKASYLQLRKEILHLESNQLDNRLHHFWEEIIREQEAEEEEAAKLQQFYKEREENIKIFQAASKIQANKAQPLSNFKKNISSVKTLGGQIFKKPNSLEDPAPECVKMEEGMETDQNNLTNNSFVSPSITSASLQNTSAIKSSFTTSDKGTSNKILEEEVKSPEKNVSSGAKDDDEDDDEEEDEGVEEEEEEDDDDDEEEEEEETVKTPEEVLEDMKCDTSFETNITLDYTSNLNVELKEQDITPEDAKKLIDVTELIKEDLGGGDNKAEEAKSIKNAIQMKIEGSEKDSSKMDVEEKLKLENVETSVKQESAESKSEFLTEKEEVKDEAKVKKEDTEDKEEDDEEDDEDDGSEVKRVDKEEGETINLEKGNRKRPLIFSLGKEDTNEKEGPEVIAKEEESSSDSRLENSSKMVTSILPEILTTAVPSGCSLSCEKEPEKKPAKKEGRDEYDFDDDASRESMEVKEFMNRSDKRKFSLGDSVSSPVISESTPSSPASTSYGDDPEAEKMHRSWKRSIMLIWNDIAAHKNASLFLKPITEDKVPGYHSIVFRPIDLMTIKRNIENGTIRTTNDFHRDILLMLLNAKMYNPRDNDIYRMAEHMMNDAVEVIEEFISAQMLAKVVETPQKTLRRETRESSAKRVVEDLKRKREEREEKVLKRRKI